MPKLGGREVVAHVGFAALIVAVFYLVSSTLDRAGPEEVANTWVWALRSADRQTYADLAVGPSSTGSPTPDERDAAWAAERACLDWNTATVGVETPVDAPFAARAAVVDRNGRSLVRFLERTADGWRIRVDTTCDA